MEKYCRAGQATDYNIGIMWHTCVALYITKTTNICSECVILLAFYSNALCAGLEGITT